ncbi:MAG: pyridoxamine 5'-phosphate oxidase family protein [Pseudomonadota bacterium]
MPDALHVLFDRVWRDLESATGGDIPCDWRRLNLATVDRSGAPQSRLVILRKVDRTLFRLRFHTDVRGAKWDQIAYCPAVCLLGYSAQSHEQIRFSGNAQRFGPGAKGQQEAWAGLSDWQRAAFCGGPPGRTISQPTTTAPRATAPSRAETEPGQRHFGVIDVHVSKLDWYQHPRGDLRRARFDMTPEEGLTSASWVEP